MNWLVVSIKYISRSRIDRWILLANGFIVFLMAIMIVYVFVIMSYLSKLEEESEIYKKGIDSILNLPEIEGEYKKYFSKVDYIYRGLASDIGQSAIVDSLSEMASSSGVTISKQSYRDINEGIRVGYEVDLKLTGDYFSVMEFIKKITVYRGMTGISHFYVYGNNQDEVEVSMTAEIIKIEGINE